MCIPGGSLHELITSRKKRKLFALADRHLNDFDEGQQILARQWQVDFSFLCQRRSHLKLEQAIA